MKKFLIGGVIGALFFLVLIMPVTAVCFGNIGDYVWHDLNRDGIQDSGEPGIANVLVTLKDETGTVLIADSVTGADGSYQFNNVCPGTYQVSIQQATLPPLLFPALPFRGGDPEKDSNLSPELVTLPSDGASDQSIDFGYVNPCVGSAGDFVWNDQNTNGIQDTGEPGIGGVLVRLKNGAGSVTAVTSTGSNGEYLFTGLCTGAYFMEVIPPAGMGLTLVHAGSDPALDSEPNPVPFTLPDDYSSAPSIDFGFTSVSVPEFPSLALPAGLVIGMIGTVWYIRRTKRS